MNLTLRDFKVRERYVLEVRADAFGFTNTPHSANPGTSCPALADPNKTLGIEEQCTTGHSLTNPASADNGFGVITGVAQLGGFFGPDPGNRIIWLGASVKF
jgi:hypothetical protein